MAYPRGTVLSASGEPINREPRHLAAPLDMDLPSAERRMNLADAPSPAWLRAILETATKGRPREFIDFLDLMRERDGRIDSCAQRLEGAVSSLEWSVLPADVDDDQKDRAAEIANDAERMLRRIEYLPGAGSDVGQGGFEDLLLGQASMFYYGWANPELQWDYVESSKRWEPIRAAFRHPRRLTWYEVDHVPRIYDPGSLGPAGTFPGMDLEPLRWLVTRGKVRPGYPARDGLGRTAAWLYAFKRFSWKDLIQFSEQFGTPFILGVAGGGKAEAASVVDDDTATVLKDVVRTIRSRSRGVIDGRDRIDILWPQVSGKGIIPAEVITICDDEVAILFQGATQAVAVGDKGTYASAETHKGVERDKVERYGRTESNGITFGLLRGWFAINYPESAQGFDLCPAFWLNSSQPANQESELVIDRGLYDIGYPLLKSDLSDRYNRPLPDETAEEGDVLERQAAPNPFDLFAQAGKERPSEDEEKKPKETPPEEGEDEDEEDEEETKPKKAAATSRPFRFLGGSPEDFDEDGASSTLESFVSEYDRVGKAAAKKAGAEAVDVATDWLKDRSFDPGVRTFAEEITQHLSPKYAKVLSHGKFKPVVEKIYEKTKKDTRGWPKGISFDFGPEDLLFKEKLGELDSLYMSSYIKNEAAQHSVKAFLEDWYGDKGGDLFKGRMKSETIQDFRDSLGSKLENIHDWQAQRIINSSVVRVRGYADVQQMMDASVGYMQWYATSAERITCDVCRRLHGTKVDVSKAYAHMLSEAKLSPSAWIAHIKSRGPVTLDMLGSDKARREIFEVGGYQQPVHPNCRCMWLLYLTLAAADRLRPVRTMTERWVEWRQMRGLHSQDRRGQVQASARAQGPRSAQVRLQGRHEAGHALDQGCGCAAHAPSDRKPPAVRG